MAPPVTEPTAPWRNRIVGEGDEDPEQLLANPKNWRIHPSQQQVAVGTVLDTVGWIQRVIVNQRTGHVVDGHIRVSLAISRQEPSIPVLYVDLTPEEEALMLTTLDPLAAMAQTDREKLADLMLEIDASDQRVADLLERVRRDEAMTQAFLDRTLANRNPDAQAPPPPSSPVSKRGELYGLGAHRLLCGDATNAEDVARLLGGCIPEIMITDPPYGVDYDPAWRVGYDGSPRHALGEVTNDDRVDWTDAYRLYPGDVAYVWCSGVHSPEVAANITAAGFKIRSQIVWMKHHFAFGRGHYHWQHEPCWYAVRDGKSASWLGDRKQTTIWQVQNFVGFNTKNREPENEATGHSTQKPSELYTRPIVNHTNPGGRIYDPFAGSGTAIIAAEAAGRVAYAMEIEPGYCDSIIARWETFSGGRAELIEESSSDAPSNA